MPIKKRVKEVALKLARKWKRGHALRQEEFRKKKSQGYGDVSFNPFK